MSGATANGYPYAVPSDPLIQWPATSQQLAEKCDAAIVNTMAGTLSTTKAPSQNAVKAFVESRVSNAATAYTPAWTQDDGTALAIGAGTLSGQFARAGILGWFAVQLLRGSGTNLGVAGQGYLFTLPTALPAAAFRTIQGSGIVVVAGNPIPVIVQAVNATQVRLVRAKDESRIGASTGSWNATDSIYFTGTYQVGPVSALALPAPAPLPELLRDLDA